MTDYKAEADEQYRKLGRYRRVRRKELSAVFAEELKLVTTTCQGPWKHTAEGHCGCMYKGSRG
jgi:hypothetical protein